MKRVGVFFLILLFPLVVSAATSATAILIDISRSVPPDDFQRAKVLIRGIVEEAGSDDIIEVYAFGNEVRKISTNELESLQPSESFTMLFDAAYDVAQILDGIEANRKSIIIISDGRDTKSATILEDIAGYVNERGIAVYGIGVGDAQRKTLERIARLTGGKYIPVGSADALEQLRASQSQQKTVAASALPVAPKPPTTIAPEPGPVVTPIAPEPKVATPAEPSPVAPPPAQRSMRFIWIGGAAAGLLLLIAAGWVLMRALRKEERTCPTCGRTLESYQTVCPGCASPLLQQKTADTQSPDSTFEMAEGEEQSERGPLELLEKRPVTEEMLSKTFVLMETPMLVIRKGRNIGQSFSLNRVYPVSIGRSRVNEIKLEDVTISGQHCRIIPENGKHVLYDLGSTNGTFVNEKRVNNRTTLTEGDIIKVGETQFLFKVEQQRN